MTGTYRASLASAIAYALLFAACTPPAGTPSTGTAPGGTPSPARPAASSEPGPGSSAPASAATSELIINSCGGAYGEAIQSAFITPFSAESGIAVTYDSSCDDQTTKLQGQVEAGQVAWDVIAGFGGPIYKDMFDRGLLVEIDHAALGSAAAGLTHGSIQPYGLGFHHDGAVLGYHAGDFPGETPTVADFFDLEGFPGTRGMTAGGFEDWVRPAIALVADGVAPADLIPLDWDRAFAKLDPIKEDVLFWHGGQEMFSMMVEHQAAMCLCSDARMIQARREEPDIQLAFDGAYRALIFWAVPVNAPHPEAATAFLRSTLNADRHAAFTQAIGYSGVVEASYEGLPTDLQSQVMVNPANLARTWSFTAEQDAWLAEHASEASERYATWVSE